MSFLLLIKKLFADGGSYGTRDSWWHGIRDLCDLLTEVASDDEFLRKALKQHCFEDRQTPLSARMNMNLTVPVSDGPTRLVPSESSEKSSLAAASKITRAQSLFLELFRKMFPILTIREHTIKLEPLFWKFDVMMFCFSQTSESVANCQPVRQFMISITIGLILLAGLTGMLVNTSTSHRELQKSSMQNENGRYAIQLLSEDIRLAGFYGEYSPPSGTSSPYINRTVSPGVILDPCTATIANLGWNNSTSLASQQSPVAIYGYAGNGATPTACATVMANRPTPAAGMPAMLTVRRAQTVAFAAATANGTTTYLQASLCPTPSTDPPFLLGTGSFTLKQKDCDTAPPGTNNIIHKYTVDTYFIDSCNKCSPASDGIPTLKLVQFVDGAVTLIPLVEGIEDMQFDYGIDSDGDGSPDSYVAAPTATQWVDVVAVRIYLLARNSEFSAGYTENGTYDMGLAGTVQPCVNGPFKTVASCSNFKRHAFSSLVRVENPSARRETP